MKGGYGTTLVACQFVLFILLIATTSWPDLHLFALPFLFASLFLAAWAIRVMRLGHFNVRPTIKEGAILITHGPYRYVRHPMYSSILLAGLGLLLVTFSWLRFLAFCVLWLVLYLKLRIEEGLLGQHFSDYASYQKQSRMLGPWL